MGWLWNLCCFPFLKNTQNAGILCIHLNFSKLLMNRISRCYQSEDSIEEQTLKQQLWYQPSIIEKLFYKWTLVIVNAWKVNNLSLVNIFGDLHWLFYNINCMLNSKHLSLVNKIGDKTEFTITRVHCIWTKFSNSGHCEKWRKNNAVQTFQSGHSKNVLVKWPGEENGSTSDKVLNRCLL